MNHEERIKQLENQVRVLEEQLRDRTEELDEVRNIAINAIQELQEAKSSSKSYDCLEKSENAIAGKMRPSMGY